LSYIICVYYHCVIRYEVGFFGYCSFSLVPFVLLGVCFTTLSIYCVITIVRKFGVIWIYRSCFIKLLLFWQLVFQIWILISVAFLGNNFTVSYLGFYLFLKISYYFGFASLVIRYIFDRIFCLFWNYISLNICNSNIRVYGLLSDVDNIRSYYVFLVFGNSLIT
jgi:hypothetical protein